jgi:hypothetical protein
LLTPAASLRGERPYREKAKKDHQGDRGTVAVERVHSLASPGKGTEGRFSVCPNDTVEGCSSPLIRHLPKVSAMPDNSACRAHRRVPRFAG